jgi:hypothetical protein
MADFFLFSSLLSTSVKIKICRNTRWFKYDRDKLWLVYTQILPVIFEPPCIIFPVVLHGCETWTFTLREEFRLRVFENKLYFSPNIIRMIKRQGLAEHVARMGERRGPYGVLVGKPEGWRPLERPRRRWEDNIKMDLREMGWGHGLNRSGRGKGQMAGFCYRGN